MNAATASGVVGSSSPSLVYFAKVPHPGRVKTRLCPPLSPDEAAALYTAFLRACIRPWPGARTFVYGWPEDSLADLRPVVPPGVELRPQRGADLWERLRHCFAERFAAGDGPVIVRNTDSPDLPPARIAEALDRSRPGRVVLGPDTGGGYYLVGLGAPCPGLFDDLREGPDPVFARTVARARQLDLEVVTLAEERDIDTFDDLLAMWRAR